MVLALQILNNQLIMSLVYNHKRKDTNEIFYIGIGKSEKRVRSKHNRNQYWHNIVNRYGYISEISHIDICWEEACAIEKYLISFYGRKDLGLGNLINLTDGGEGIYNTSEEVRLKTKLNSLKANKTPEVKLKRHLAQKGNQNCLGRILSQETKNKIRDAQKGRPLSEEHKAKLLEARNKDLEKSKLRNLKISKTLTGKKHTEESKSKMSKSRLGKQYALGTKRTLECRLKQSERMKGSNHHFFGKSHSEETKRKISETKRLKTQIIEKK